MKILKLISDIRKLAAGTHFLTAYGDKRGGPRVKKAEVNWPTGEPAGDNTITLEGGSHVSD